MLQFRWEGVISIVFAILFPGTERPTNKQQQYLQKSHHLRIIYGLFTRLNSMSARRTRFLSIVFPIRFISIFDLIVRWKLEQKN